MRVILGQDLRQSSGGLFRLLGLLRIDHGDEKVLELREELFEGLGALPPRQARGEHLVGVGRDAEMAARVPPGKDRQSGARQDYPNRINSAAVDQAAEQ